jgi:outer membrane protein assembly factor BamB
VFASDTLTLHKIAVRDGRVDWEKKIRAARSQSGEFLTVAGGLILYRTPEGFLQALDAETGAERWQTPGVNDVLSSSEEHVYVADQDWMYTTLAAQTGEVLKRTEIRLSFPYGFARDAERSYLFNDRLLTVTEISTGRQLWEYRLESSRPPFTPLKFNVVDGNLYASDGGLLRCFDAQTGKVKWQYPFTGDVPDVTDGSLYLGADGKTSSDGVVVRLNAETGEVLFSVTVSGLHFGGDYKVLVRDGVIYDPASSPHYGNYSLARFFSDKDKAVSHDAWINAISERDGQILWRSEKFWGADEIKPLMTEHIIIFTMSSISWENSSQLIAYTAN